MKKSEIVELLNRTGGVLKLKPEYVQRFYPDLNRLGQKKFKKSAKQNMPERWIASSVQAINPPPIPSGGLSMIETRGGGGGAPLSLRDAVKLAPREMLGEKLLRAHGPQFRVLVKILDPGESIVFHLHATDEQVKRMPRNFRGHQFGKDEAYYFLEAPKGPMPYTHVGLYSGVTRKQLVDAVKKGREYALELSPQVYQEFETGFFVPAGIPHRPGTALTLEIQQPSDVYTLLETHAGGKAMSPQQMHPGFKSLDEAFGLIDFKVSERVGKLDANRLKPVPINNATGGGGEIASIFPLNICKKFGGDRIRVKRRITYKKDRPYALLVWEGRGRLNGKLVRAGEEFFVSDATARRGIELTNEGSDRLEAFSLFPGV